MTTKTKKRYSPEVEQMVKEAKANVLAKQAGGWTKVDFAEALKELLTESIDGSPTPEG